MSERPTPLDPGERLQGRFETETTLGQGGFGITYRARDLQRGDLCILRELAPDEAVRQADGVLKLSPTGEAASQRLRQRFQQEARRLSRISLPTLLPIRAGFVERGTVYVARELAPEALTLAERVAREGKLSPAEAEELLGRLSESLDHLHRQGIYHLDLRPSNILLTPSGSAFLIDFGEARKWRQDLFHLEELRLGLPPEMAMRGSRVGPEVDVYGLGASLIYGLTGIVPDPSVPAEETLIQIPGRLSESLARAVRSDPKDRPRNAFVLGQIARGEEVHPSPKEVLQTFDQKALELKQLRFDRRQCPGCGEVLESPKPLRLGICPVCHEGKIRARKIVERLCPHCRMGTLKHIANLEPLSICPICTEGLLHRRRKKLFSKEFNHVCENCDAVFEWRAPEFILLLPPESSDLEPGTALSCNEWRGNCGRSSEIWLCSGCSAQFDRISDGRWRQQIPAKTGKFDALEPNEWARVAAGLPPEAGNSECDACGADFYVEGEDVALLESRFDPHHFAERNAGRLLTLTALQWIGVGKESPNPGLVCSDCDTEFDLDGQLLKLIRSTNPGLIEHHGESLTLENWHRAGKDLPLIGQENGFEEAFQVALRSAFVSGDVPFSDRDKDLIWKGPAVRYAAGEEGLVAAGAGQLLIQKEEISFGGWRKKDTVSMAEVRSVRSEENRLVFETSGEEGDGIFEIEPMRLKVQLDSGTRALELTAIDLEARLKQVLATNSELNHAAVP